MDDRQEEGVNSNNKNIIFEITKYFNWRIYSKLK